MIFMIHSPLEQFAIISLIPINLGNSFTVISFTNSSFFMLCVIFTVLLFFYKSTSSHAGGNKLYNPSALQSFVEMIYEFILHLLNEQISGPNHKKQPFFPLIFVTFVFLFFSNLIGMIPYSFTVTRDRKSVV